MFSDRLLLDFAVLFGKKKNNNYEQPVTTKPTIVTIVVQLLLIYQCGTVLNVKKANRLAGIWIDFMKLNISLLNVGVKV